MTNNPASHPDTPESGRQIITLEHRTKLLKVIRDAQALIDFAWRARFASYYNDNKLALNALNEVRLYEYSINQHLKTLPPTADFPENEQ